MIKRLLPLDRAQWFPDRMILGDLVFRLEHYKNDDWDLGDQCLAFFKVRGLVDQYQEFWALRPSFRAENVVELGIWDGGGAAFWFEMLDPRKLIAVDYSPRGDSDYFRRYVARRILQERLKTYWGTDQADRSRLQRIVEDEFQGPLDLVLDDASHVYEPTLASFETLFPLLRPGGFYIIEDWAWAHWKEFQGPRSPFAGRTAPTKLICELVEAAGSVTGLIASLTVMVGFTAVERGPMALDRPQAFSLRDYISREPWPRITRVRALARQKLRRLTERMRLAG